MALPVAAVLKIVKDGLFTLYAASSTICEVTRWSREIVQKKYPTNTALHAAMDAVQSACQALRLSIVEQKEVDKSATGAPADPSTPPVPPAPEPEPEP